MGRRRVLTTWAVGEAWERFTNERQDVIRRSFRVIGLSLPIDGSCDEEISIKGIDKTYLIEGLKDWGQGEGSPDGDENNAGGADEDEVELDEAEDEIDVFYEDFQ